ncbi:hypothetical protein CCAX7_32920 [Capsulimonas corticalis]|uniref:Uncharacterized protein n=1 Tax=Capsulimonas corticalis TaxID=2219043 RepID=A0A402CYN4_9BACT|nr:SpoIVB peptidase S55 domain-containing protein [Capsulimonas corticalis]BDI31241.1 hypothetical protein CCAX7_32920 [Capsulimonas corticalis]
MKYRPGAAALAAISLLATGASARPTISAPHPNASHRFVFDTKKFMRVSELRPGMRGYALSVFKGTKIEKFDIEILGVVAKFNNGKDYILFRALNGPSVTRKLNIAHGMSGSPIYINGRLVGAISMGIPGTQFAKDPIALATPIEEMFDAWSPDLPSNPNSISASPDAGGKSYGGSYSATPISPDAASRLGNFQQMDIPLVVSGVSAHGVSQLNSLLAPYHFDVMAGGGSAPTDNNPLAQHATLEPGSAVGVSLVQGDVDMTATGTVTYRDGNRLLLFGHPLSSLGPIDAALTTAYVVDIFPSYQDSIKLGAPIKTVGRIFQDRPYSVGAQIGPMPKMIPMTVTVDDQSIKRTKTYRVRIIDHPLLTAQFVTYVAGQAISQLHGQPGDTVATVSFDADVEEIGHVHRSNTYYDALSIDQSAVGDLDNFVRLLSANPFYPLSLKSLKMNVTIRDSHDTAEIQRIFVKQSKFAPGDTIDVGVVMKPYKREQVLRTVQVKVPSATPNGPLTLSVKGGGSDGGSVSLGGIIIMRTSAPGSPVSNVSQLVKQFEEKPHNDDLVARLVLPTVAVNIEGEKLSNLPPTYAAVMASSRSTGLKTERDDVKVTQKTPYIVSGSQSLTITIEKKSFSETPQDTRQAPAAPQPAQPAAGGASTDLSAGQDDGSDDESSTLDTSGASPNNLMAFPGMGASSDVTSSQFAAAPATPATPATPSPATPAAPALPAAATAPAATATPPVATVTPVVKPVGRLASVWRQDAGADFIGGKLENTSVTSKGDLRLSPPLTKLAETPETYVWALLPDGAGSVYAGTGDRGFVDKIDADGKAHVFYKTSELEVTALARDGEGNVYAGAMPKGRVFKISPNGQGHLWYTAPEHYVTSLVYDAPRKRVLVATGGASGGVYAVSESGIGTRLLQTPDAHVLSLAINSAGDLYAGTSPDGVIYKIDLQGKSKVFYDLTEASVASLATDSAGNVYAGTAPKGAIYRITPDGVGKSLYDRITAPVLSLHSDKMDNVYASSGSTIYKVLPDQTVEIFVSKDDEQFLTSAVENDGSAVYAGAGTVGAVYKIASATTNALTGHFESTIHDAGRTARWGSLQWSADQPAGTTVEVRTRSGDTSLPDASWTAWSAPYTKPQGEPITSPAARYLQYQVTFQSSESAMKAGQAPQLHSVTAYYLPKNQPPTVKITSPATGDALSKTATLRWSASDPDQDTLTYDLSYSSDAGKTWTPIKKHVPTAPTPPAATPTAPGAPAAGAKPATPAAAPAAPAKLTYDQRLALMKADLAKHPEIPAGIREQLLAQAPDIIHKAMANEAANPAPAPVAAVKDTSFAWDTTDVADGQYEVRVVASDKSSNPKDALTAESISGIITIANKAPALTTSAPVVGTDKTVTIQGTATSSSVFVKAVQYRVDNGDWMAAAPDDGLFDSTHEAFSFTTIPLTTGAHTIQIQSLDMAGNSATSTVKTDVK